VRAAVHGRAGYPARVLAAPSKLTPGAPAMLQIRFAAGERPHLFWVSIPVSDDAASVYKVLSKALPDGALEAVLIEEDAQGRRRGLGRIDVPPGHPAGWLTRWVEMAAEELGARFRLYDLRSVASAEEWTILAGQLGWLRAPGREGPA
jgi:hypothetical protein